MDKRKRAKFLWSDPHDGVSGATVRLPATAKAIAAKLAGTVSTAEAAINKVMGAVGSDFTIGFSFDVSYGCGTVETSETHGMLTMTAGDLTKGQPMHLWRLLKGTKQ